MIYQIEKKDIMLALLSTALLGFNIVASKMGVAHFPPLLFTALRFLVCVPLLCFFPTKQIPIKDLLYVSFCWGILYLGGINFALYSGLSAGTTILITNSSVFLTVILSAVFFKDIPTFRQIVGIFIGFFGIFLICMAKGFIAHTMGLLALFISAFSFAIGTLLVKKSNCNPLSLNVWISFISAIPMFFLSFIFEDNLLETLSSATLFQWGSVLFAGLGSMLLGGTIWTHVVKKYSLSAVAPFRLMAPVFGILFAVVFLSESYPIMTWIGASLAFFGLIINQFKFDYNELFNKTKNNKYIASVKSSIVLSFFVVGWGYTGIGVSAKHTSNIRNSATPLSDYAGDVIPVAIIGGGCAGLSAAMVISEYGFHTVVFMGPLKGGELNVKTEVGNWPGIETTMGNTIMPTLLDQASRFGAEFLSETISSVNFLTTPFELKSSTGNVYKANKVIIATGTAERQLEIEGARENRSHLLYNWDIHQDVQGYIDACKGKKVAVIGSGIDAMKKAFYAAKGEASEVIIFSRKKDLKLSPWRKKVLDIKKDTINIKYYSEITKIQKFNNKTRLIFKNETHPPYDADVVVVSIGRVPRNEAFDSIKKNKNGFILVNKTNYETNIPGVYACGDITEAMGPHPQAAIASGSGMITGYIIVEQLIQENP